MKILGVIPARFASTRLEAKSLLLIGDKPMVVHVYQNALKSTSLNHVIIATDHQKIFDTCKDFGCHVIMLSLVHI